MTFHRILFVGLGGAGQRHLRIFRDLLPDAEMTCLRRTGATPVLNADFSVAEGATLEERYDVAVTDDADAAFAARPDLTVIATPSSLHLDPMNRAVTVGSSVFVEKPWSDSTTGFTEFRRQVEARGLAFFISFQRRHHPLIERAAALVRSGRLGRIVNAVFNVASYVPIWHGYEDWRRLYAVRPELGGGVLLTEIHELDLAAWFFGPPKSVFCSGGNYGEFALDVEDTVHLTLGYDGFDVQVNLCFMQRQARRDFFVAGTDGHVSWNQNGNAFEHVDYASGAAVRDALPEMTCDTMFVCQARAFLDDHGPERTTEQLDAAEISQAIVDSAKASMRSQRSEPLAVERY